MAFSATPKAEIQGWLEDGLRHYAKADAARALEAWHRVLDADPDHAMAKLYVAHVREAYRLESLNPKKAMRDRPLEWSGREDEVQAHVDTPEHPETRDAGADGAERRVFPRAALSVDAWVARDGARLHTATQDMSFGGVRLKAEAEWGTGDSVSLELMLTDGEHVTLKGRVAWKRGDWIGVSFVDMSPSVEALIQRTVNDALGIAGREDTGELDISIDLESDEGKPAEALAGGAASANAMSSARDEVSEEIDVVVDAAAEMLLDGARVVEEAVDVEAPTPAGIQTMTLAAGSALSESEGSKARAESAGAGGGGETAPTPTTDHARGSEVSQASPPAPIPTSEWRTSVFGDEPSGGPNWGDMLGSSEGDSIPEISSVGQPFSSMLVDAPEGEGEAPPETAPVAAVSVEAAPEVDAMNAPAVDAAPVAAEVTESIPAQGSEPSDEDDIGLVGSAAKRRRSAKKAARTPPVSLETVTVAPITVVPVEPSAVPRLDVAAPGDDSIEIAPVTPHDAAGVEAASPAPGPSTSPHVERVPISLRLAPGLPVASTLATDVVDADLPTTAEPPKPAAPSAVEAVGAELSALLFAAETAPPADSPAVAAPADAFTVVDGWAATPAANGDDGAPSNGEASAAGNPWDAWTGEFEAIDLDSGRAQKGMFDGLFDAENPVSDNIADRAFDEVGPWRAAEQSSPTEADQWSVAKAAPLPIDLGPLEPLSPAAAAAETMPPPSVETMSAPEPEDECATLMVGARELFALGDFSGSLELVEKVLAVSPDNEEARAYLTRNEGTLLKMYESKLGDLGQVPRPLITPEEVIWMNLHHRAGFVLAQIDGTLSYGDVLEVSGMPRLETVRILAELLQSGAISIAA